MAMIVLPSNLVYAEDITATCSGGYVILNNKKDDIKCDKLIMGSLTDRNSDSGMIGITDNNKTKYAIIFKNQKNIHEIYAFYSSNDNRAYPADGFCRTIQDTIGCKSWLFDDKLNKIGSMNVFFKITLPSGKS